MSEDEVAMMLYMASRKSSHYSPSWVTAPNKAPWRAAARAVRRASEQGLL